MWHMTYNCTRYCLHDVHANIRVSARNVNRCNVYAAVRWPLMDVEAKSIRVYHTARISHCTRLHRIPKRCLRVRGEYRATFTTAFTRASGTLHRRSYWFNDVIDQCDIYVSWIRSLCTVVAIGSTIHWKLSRIVWLSHFNSVNLWNGSLNRLWLMGNMSYVCFINIYNF